MTGWKATIYTDGGSRGNPGPAAAAFVIYDSQKRLVAARAYYLGIATNNVAEYTAVEKALEYALSAGAVDVELYCDSQLVACQLTGQYKVKSELILPLFQKCLLLLYRFRSKHIQYIAREKNHLADQLVNRALDAQMNIDQTTAASSAAAAADPMVSHATTLTAGRHLRLGVLLSGGGRTMVNIHNEITAGNLNASIVCVISSRSTVAGVQRAKDIGIEPVIIRRKDYQTLEDFSRAIVQTLDAHQVDLVIQAGWLCLWQIPEKYNLRVMNIHPSLLPAFGGQGMWGHHVHEAVLKHGCKISGCTVHFCTNEYDVGPIIIQRACPVEDDDTPDTLAARVFEQECIAYPEAIRLFSQDRLIVRNGVVYRKK